MKDVDQVLLNLKHELELMPDYSQLQVHFKKHLGMYNDPEATKMFSIKVTSEEPNVVALTKIANLIKATCENKVPGTLGFSVVVDSNGNVKQILVQDFKKL